MIKKALFFSLALFLAPNVQAEKNTSPVYPPEKQITISARSLLKHAPEKLRTVSFSFKQDIKNRFNTLTIHRLLSDPPFDNTTEIVPLYDLKGAEIRVHYTLQENGSTRYRDFLIPLPVERLHEVTKIHIDIRKDTIHHKVVGEVYFDGKPAHLPQQD